MESLSVNIAIIKKDVNIGALKSLKMREGKCKTAVKSARVDNM